MSAVMELASWLDATERNYLEDFIPQGGAAVKFAVATGDTSTHSITAGIATRGDELGYIVASIDASRVKISSIEQMFSSITQQIDLGFLVDRLVVELGKEQHWIAPADGSEPLGRRIALANDMDEGAVVVALRPMLTERIFRNSAIAQDMRAAFLNLALQRLAGGETMTAAFSTIGDWLAARNVTVKSLSQFQIRSKVNRSNARHLLGSLLEVIKTAGLPGLLVTVDISRFMETDKRPDEINYAKSTLLDAYEVLREFIDSTDDLENFLMVVTAPVTFLDPNTRGRGLGRYPALFNRVYDEIRDRNLSNPLSALVRIGTSSDGVSA